MRGPCMCGDYLCPSCGPAQGYSLEAEQVYEWFACFSQEKGFDFTNDELEVVIRALDVLSFNKRVRTALVQESDYYFLERSTELRSE